MNNNSSSTAPCFDLDETSWKELRERFEAHRPQYESLWRSLQRRRQPITQQQQQRRRRSEALCDRDCQCSFLVSAGLLPPRRGGEHDNNNNNNRTTTMSKLLEAALENEEDNDVSSSGGAVGQSIVENNDAAAMETLLLDNKDSSSSSSSVNNDTNTSNDNWNEDVDGASAQPTCEQDNDTSGVGKEEENDDDECSATSQTTDDDDDDSSGGSTVVHFEVSFEPTPTDGTKETFFPNSNNNEEGKSPPSSNDSAFFEKEPSLKDGVSQQNPDTVVEEKEESSLIREEEEVPLAPEQETPTTVPREVEVQLFRSPVIDLVEDDYSSDDEPEWGDTVKVVDEDDDSPGLSFINSEAAHVEYNSEDEGLDELIHRTKDIALLDEKNEPKSRPILSVEEDSDDEASVRSDNNKNNNNNNAEGWSRSRDDLSLDDAKVHQPQFRDREASGSESSLEAEWNDDDDDDDEYGDLGDDAEEDNDLAREFNQSVFIVDSDDEEDEENNNWGAEDYEQAAAAADDDDDFDFSDGDSLDSLKLYKRRLSQVNRAPPMTKAAFARNRQSLAEQFFSEFDKKVFGGQLSPSTEIKWSKTLRTTAGQARMHRSRVDHDTRTVTIELSIKVLDEVSRLRETLLHEMCHAATWLIDRVDKPGHGVCFQRWGRRGENKFSDLTVSTRHNYEITYKHTWTCVKCQSVIGRQSRSIDPERQVCGKCHGKLVETTATTQKRKPSAYNLFVGEHSGRIRQQMELSGETAVSQAAVLKECARLWRARNPSE